MDTFSKAAPDWDKNERRVKLAKILANEINVTINKREYATALEFGCGTGLLSFELKDRFASITLVDNAKGMMEEVKKKIDLLQVKNLVPYCGNIEDAKLKPVDVIFTHLTMHHIHDLKFILTTLYKLLKQDGMLIISDLVEEDGSFHVDKDEDVPHNGFNKNNIEQVLSSIGFKLNTYQVYKSIIKVMPDSSERKFPLFLLSATK